MAMITIKRMKIHLPMEIMEELFIRVPAKSITKFKCLSKEWNNIISGHRFRSRYQSQHRPACRSGYFYYSNAPLCSSTSQSYMSRLSPAKFINVCNIGKEDLALCHDLQNLGPVLGTSNGLLLLGKHNTIYYVYDLLTKKAANIPQPKTIYDYVSTGFVCKEGEQDCLTNINNSNYHYKIVRVGVNNPIEKRTTYELETYSSQTRIWQKSSMTATSQFHMSPVRPPKVIGGVLHWKNDLGNILAYNPEDPSGRVISIKVPILNDFLHSQITSSGERLFICDGRNSSNDIDMWFLGSSYLDEDVVDRNLWTFFGKVCFTELGRSLGDALPTGPLRRLFAIDFHPRDSSVIFLRMNDKFISYNLYEKRVELIRSFKGGERFSWPFFYFHIEWPLWPRL